MREVGRAAMPGLLVWIASCLACGSPGEPGAPAPSHSDAPSSDSADDDGSAVSDDPDTGEATVSSVDTGSAPADCTADPLTDATLIGDLGLGETVTGSLEGSCAASCYALILAKGQRATVTLQGDALLAGLRLYGPGERGLQAQATGVSLADSATLDFTADLTGEYFVVVFDASHSNAGPFELSATCTKKCDLQATRYPIILVHGFSGFEDVLGVEYFYKVRDTWSNAGFDLHTAQLAPFNASEERGTQLASFIDQVLAETSAYKVNLIAHSQGGVDARYAIGALGYGDRIGALYTLSTPHHGTAIADAALENPAVMATFKAMFAAVGIAIETEEEQHNLEASLESMSTAAMAAFNAHYPDDPRVRYKSWAARSCPLTCKNPMYVFLWPTYEIIRRRLEEDGKLGDNDGIVPTESGVWTGFEGIVEADHFRQPGHLVGDTGTFHHLKFYGDAMKSMAQDGL